MKTQAPPLRTRIRVSEAQTTIHSFARSWKATMMDLGRARGRPLRSEVVADRDFPPFDRVTMDGIAVSYTRLREGQRRFRVDGMQAAGAPQSALKDDTACVEVMTGAVLPSGTDCVIPFEDLDRDGDFAVLRSSVEAEQLQFVHRRGSDYGQGTVLLPAGTKLGPAELAVCATVGLERVEVTASPRIALVATGDELVPVGARPEPHQIRMSNPFAMRAALESCGYSAIEVRHLPDDEEAMARSLAEVLDASDVVVLSGGVSAGRFDLVPGTLERLGVRAAFHKVLQRPGLPLWFGVRDGGPVVFGLPGNPVSSLVSVRRHVIPFLELCDSGVAPEPEHAVLAEQYEFRPDLTLFLPVFLTSDADGRLLAHPRPVHGSGDFARLKDSEGFVELPADRSLFEAGTVFPLYRWGRQ